MFMPLRFLCPLFLEFEENCASGFLCGFTNVKVTIVLEYAAQCVQCFLVGQKG